MHAFKPNEPGLDAALKVLFWGVDSLKLNAASKPDSLGLNAALKLQKFTFRF